MSDPDPLPVVVVGAGPVGLAVAAHLQERGEHVLVLEAGPAAGAAVSAWGHVRLFSPWSELVDPAAARILGRHGWSAPPPGTHPTGADWVERYLRPLAEALAGVVRTGATVTNVTRRDRDRVVASGRAQAPFALHVRVGGDEVLVPARAVVDASGTWSGPGSLGGDGVPALGEADAADRVTYRVPDLRDPVTRARLAGRHVVVAGSGASASTALVGLVRLAREEPGTRISWLVRRGDAAPAFDGGSRDQLPARGALGDRARAAVADGPVTTVSSFRTTAVERGAHGRLRLWSSDGRVVEDVDEAVVLTGFRPDLSFVGEVQLDLDPVLQAPRALAPLIDPNVHSCGTVPPHGAVELAHPEAGFFVVGAKSYGRATSFLALTGFEQARSVAAELAGDHAAAAQVELVLPATGVCGGAGDLDEPDTQALGGCCGGAQVRAEPRVQSSQSTFQSVQPLRSSRERGLLT